MFHMRDFGKPFAIISWTGKILLNKPTSHLNQLEPHCITFIQHHLDFLSMEEKNKGVFFSSNIPALVSMFNQLLLATNGRSEARAGILKFNFKMKNKHAEQQRI